jgi:uncharacterized caspase-like protein
MRRALVVGINHYANLQSLWGCTNDARAVASVLRVHGDEHRSPNFGVKLVTASNASEFLTRAELRERIRDLFANKADIALLYFAGHGHVETTGGYLCASDCRSGDDGVALSDVLKMADDSKAPNRVIVLDCCHSGVAGEAARGGLTQLSDGMTILTAATKSQYASEANGSGVFTALLVDALNGAAANLVGDITPGSVYAHVDQSLGSWGQRPVFKTNVETFVSLRKVTPTLTPSELRRLIEFFPTPGSQFPLNPSYEPELQGRPEGAEPPDPENTAKFALLQRLNRVNLLVPVGAPHMWHAAMHRKSCRLTPLGEHYRRLAEQDLIGG